jgi:hypothetical protein
MYRDGVAPQTLLLATVAAVLGLVAGVRRGGSLSNLANADLLWWPLFFFAIGLIGLADVAPDLSLDLGLIELTAVGLSVVGLGLLVALAARNSHLVGVPIIALGLALNLLGTAANDGFPVDRGALVAARVESSNTVDAASFSGARHLRTTDDSLWWLGDAIPVRELEYVMSFGDLVVIAGLGCAVSHLTRRRKAQPPPPLSPDARAGLVSIAAPDVRLDEPIIDLALVAEAADRGYAARPSAPAEAGSNGDADNDNDAEADGQSDAGSHDEREPGPRLGDGTEPASRIGIPVLRET